MQPRFAAAGTCLVLVWFPAKGSVAGAGGPAQEDGLAVPFTKLFSYLDMQLEAVFICGAFCSSEMEGL